MRRPSFPIVLAALLAACSAPAPEARLGEGWRTLGSHEAPVVKQVLADQLWNPTGVWVEAGHTYVFEVALLSPWRDGPIDCPSGHPADNGWWPDCSFETGWRYPFDLLAFLRRAPNANWYELVGEIVGERPQRFPLRDGGEVTAEVGGPLFVYANDWVVRYGNNRGEARVTIKHVR